jgi:hypothetical protein
MADGSLELRDHPGDMVRVWHPRYVDAVISMCYVTNCTRPSDATISPISKNTTSGFDCRPKMRIATSGLHVLPTER